MHPHLKTCNTYLITLIRLSAPCITSLNTLSWLHILIHALPMLIHWVGFRLHILIHALPILIHCPTIPYLNTLSRTIPYLITLTRTIPSLKTWNQTIPYLNTLTRTIPYLNTLIRIHLDFGNSSCQPIRIEYYVARVVSQSESSITSLGSQSNSSIT